MGFKRFSWNVPALLYEKKNRYNIMFLVLGAVTLTLFVVYSHTNSQSIWTSPDLKRLISSSDNIESLLKVYSNHSTDTWREYSSRLLHTYKRQLSEYSEADFLPQVSGSHLVLHVRLEKFILDTAHINWSSQYRSEPIKLLFFCYEIPSTIPACNISLTILLSANRTMKIINYTAITPLSLSSTASSEYSNVPGSSNTIQIHTPLRISENKSYRFTFRIQEKSPPQADIESKFLRWPLWPLTPNCANHHLKLIIGNQTSANIADEHAEQCSTTTVLFVSSSQQAFELERSSISTWLDLQYSASSSYIFDATKPRNKHSFENVSKPSVCPLAFQNWVMDYQNWHANISRQLSEPYSNFSQLRNRILKDNIRFVVYLHFDSGIADRFVHLIATYLVALLTRRFLILDDTWPELHQVMRLSLAAEQRNVAPWLAQMSAVNDNLSSSHTDYISQRLLVMRLERIAQDFNYDKDYPERILLLKSHTGNVIHTLTSSSSIYSAFLQSNLSMTTANIYGCLYHSLMIPQLSTLTSVASVPTDTSVGYSLQNLLQLLLSSRYYLIGMQIRTGDDAMSSKSSLSASPSHWSDNGFLSTFDGFFSCADTVIRVHADIQKNQIPLVYLLSDSHLVRREALRVWPACRAYWKTNTETKIQVVTHTEPVSHISLTKNPLEAFQDGMFEAFLLSMCEQHIITTESGFGRFPAFVAMRGRNIYTLNPRERSECSKGVTLAEAGHHYSGI